jgi:hypothetical protein
VTPAFVACVGLTLLLLVMAANALVVHYARGVLQGAVEEGARQAVAAGDPAACAQRVTAAVVQGLGSMADEVAAPACTLDPLGATASARATFAGWLPGAPATDVQVTASATGRSARPSSATPSSAAPGG